jgi:hypothetical protein
MLSHNRRETRDGVFAIPRHSFAQPYAARTKSALRCFSRGITSCFNRVSE